MRKRHCAVCGKRFDAVGHELYCSRTCYEVSRSGEPYADALRDARTAIGALEGGKITRLRRMFREASDGQGGD